MPKPETAAPKSAGQIAFDMVVAKIALSAVSEGSVCTAAGVARNVLAQARSKGGELSLDTIEKFATFWEMPVSTLLGEVPAPPSAAGVRDERPSRVPLLDIMPSPLNPRKTFDEAALNELCDSIAELGLQQNLGVRANPDYFDIDDAPWHLVFGERRWRALNRLAEQGRLPADIAKLGVPVVYIEGDDAEHLEQALCENLQRQDVNPMEEAEGFAALQRINPEKYTTDYLRQRIGCSRRHVQLRLQLVTKLTEEVQVALREDRITLAQARVLTMADEVTQNTSLKNKNLIAGTAAQLRETLAYNWVPLDWVRFDTADLQAHIVTDTDSGKRWFTDKKLFMQLQERAVADILSAAKHTYAWTEKSYYFYPGDYETERAKPDTLGGFFVEMDYRGKVELHRGVIKSQRRAGEVADNSKYQRRRDIEIEFRQERKGDAASFERSIAGVIRSRDAIRLLLLCAAHAGPINCYDLNDGLPMAQVTDYALRPLAPLLVADEGLGVISDEADDLQVWNALCSLEDGDLGEALAATVAGLCTVSPNGAIHPVLVAIAEREGIAVPPMLLLDYHGMLAEIDRREAIPDPQLDIEDAIGAKAAAAA